MKSARHMQAALLEAAARGTTLDAGRAHSDRIEAAIVDILRADPVLTDPRWAGQRIYRATDPDLWPDRPYPLIYVATNQQRMPLRLAGEVEITAPVEISCHYHEPRALLDAEDLSARSFLHHIWRVLTRDEDARYLRVPRFAMRPLIQRPPESALVNFGAIADPGANSRGTANDGGDDESDDTPAAERYLELQLTYHYRVSPQTGQPEGFTPDA